MTAVHPSQPAKTQELRGVKSSAGLREHIAKARAELHKSAKKIPSTPRRVRSPNGYDMAVEADVDDPFSTIKDPFNQAKFRPKSDPSIDRAIKRAREGGRLNIANTQLSRIPEAVYNMYKPDPSHVIDFSSDSGSAWYEYSDLTYFNAADNDIDTVEDEFVDTFGGVESIDLHNNKLGCIPQSFLQLGVLTSINLAGNNIDEASLSILCQIDNLVDLNVSRNRLSGSLSTKLSNLHRLTTLDISENELDAIEHALIGCTKLQKLNLSGNRIEKLGVSQLSKQLDLIELDASRNRIDTSFVDMDLTFPRLERLNLAHNAITNTTAVSNHLVLNLPVLSTLLLLQNKISNLHGLSIPAVVNLNIEGNRFTVLPDAVFDLRHLRHLDISDNQLTEIDYRLGFMPLTQLRWEGNLVRMRSCFGLSTAELLKHLVQLAPTS